MVIPPLSLDRTAGSLSRQLYDGLRVAILAGQFRVGTRMPSTRALAASRITVHQAFEQLILEGLLEGRQGAGTFVAEMPRGIPIGPGVGPPPSNRTRLITAGVAGTLGP